MSTRVAVALAVLLAAAVAVLGGAAIAAADAGPTPLAPDDASALVAAAGTSGVSPSVVVDPSTALAAASAPGAVTDYESDLTLADAVGLDPTTTAATAGIRSTGGALTPAGAQKTCWSNSAWGRWGTWPYEQKITDTSYWCAVYGVKITYRTSSITGDGTLCGVSWRQSQLVGGGVGFPSFTMRSSAGFSCPTVIPWIVLHPTHHIDVRRTDTGNATIVGSG